MRARTKRSPLNGSVAALPPASTRVDGPVTPVTPERYEAARVAWIETGRVGAVQRAAQVDRDVAHRLIDSGEPSLGLAPLRAAARVVAEKVSKDLARRESAAAGEQAKVLAQAMEERVAAARRSALAQAKVLGDVEKAREEELRLVRLNRHSAIVLAQTNADLLRVSHALASSLVEDLPNLRKVGARERMGVLRTIAGVVHRTAQTAAAAVQMERLLMGEPTAILGHAPASDPTRDMTEAEAEGWLALANRAFARRRARLSPVEGSVSPDPEEVREEAVEELVSDLGEAEPA